MLIASSRQYTHLSADNFLVFLILIGSHEFFHLLVHTRCATSLLNKHRESLNCKTLIVVPMRSLIRSWAYSFPRIFLTVCTNWRIVFLLNTSAASQYSKPYSPSSLSRLIRNDRLSHVQKREYQSKEVRLSFTEVIAVSMARASVHNFTSYCSCRKAYHRLNLSGIFLKSSL